MRDRREFKDASAWFTEALSLDHNDLDTHILIGNMHMLKHEYHPAKKRFEEMSKKDNGEKVRHPRAVHNVLVVDLSLCFSSVQCHRTNTLCLHSATFSCKKPDMRHKTKLARFSLVDWTVTPKSVHPT
jgi:hypothetical protein